MAITLEIIPFGSGDALTIEDDAIVSLDATKVYNGIGRFSFTLRGDRRLEDRTKRQDRINVKVDGTTEFTGVLTQCQQNKRTGNTNLSGKGIAKRLLEGRPDYDALGGPLSYSNEFVEDVLRDYWPRTPFGNVTVTDQDGNIIVEDAEQQSADTQSEWESVLDIDSNTPLYIDNGFLKLAQTAFVFEGESSIISTTRTSVDYSDGSSTGIETNVSNNGDTGSYSFTPNYDIPASNVAVNFRVDKIDGSGNGNLITPDIEIRLNGNTLFTDQFNTNQLGLEWDDLSTDYTGGDLTAGSTYSLEIEVTDASTGDVDDELRIDVVSVYDDRYSYNFDNTVHEDNGYLDGPALYPQTVIETTDTVDTTSNIAAASVSTTYNDTSGDQRLGVSNDNGVSFIRQSNTNSLNADFTDAGRQLVTEFRLDGYDNGAQSATPRFGYLGQEIDSFSTSVDLSDEIVIINLELSRNHFDNLKTIHEKGDYIWSIKHTSDSVATIPVFSFPRGAETKSYTFDADREIDSNPEVAADQYYNTIPLQGRLLNDGTRPFAEVSDSTAVSEDGREISPGLLRDLDISSDVGAEFIARALLDKAQKNGELRGQKTIPATFSIQPGFSYPVEWLGDDPLEQTAESVQIRKTRDDAATTVDFVNRSGFARDIQELKRDQNNIGDQV